MDNWIPALWAGCIGGAGSLAYFSALYYGFIDGESILERIMPSSTSPSPGKNFLRVVWFVAIGASVAFIFQLPEGSLAPIQGFIIGTTWPTIVAQVLTGRQIDTPQYIKSEILGAIPD